MFRSANMRMLIGGQEPFVVEARDVLRAGLATAAWISVDDTGARHKGSNGFCTQIGNDHFTWFGTTDSKSRLNFLKLLRAGYSDYVINDEAVAYMRGRSLSGPVIAQLATHADRHFADANAWIQGWVSPTSRSRLIPSVSPPKAPCGAALWRTASYAIALSSATTLANSMLDFMK